MKWIDTTSHRRGTPLSERIPGTFSAECESIRLCVTKHHVTAPGSWVGHAYPIFDTRLLQASTAEEAMHEVTALVLAWLDSVRAELLDTISVSDIDAGTEKTNAETETTISLR